MAIFPKFFEAFMTYIIRLNRDKEIKLFPELSINKIFGDSFVRFISDRSLEGQGNRKDFPFKIVKPD